MTGEELKVCPFCNEPVRMLLRAGEDDTSWIMHVARVGAPECGLQEFSDFNLTGNLVAAWNTHATPPPAQGKDLEAAARAICKARGIDPDLCVQGSGWTGGKPGEGGSICYRRAWQDYAGDAKAALAALSQSTGAEQAREGLQQAARYVEGAGGVIPGACVFAPLVSGNNMPCMSGDPRDRLHPHKRRAFDDATQSLADAIRALASPSIGESG